MYFFIQNDEKIILFKNNNIINIIQNNIQNNTIWDKVSADIKKEFDREPVYNKNYLNTKIKSHSEEVRDFYDEKIPQLDSNHTCLAVISLDSTLKKNGNYYPQVFLKECKYIEKKVVRHINDNSSDFSYSSESDFPLINVWKLFRSANFFLL